MQQPPSAGAGRLPGWLVGLASLAIAFHLGGVVVGALAAPSGPWPTPEGPNPMMPPPFAASLNEFMTRVYTSNIKMNYHYHFGSNAPNPPGVWLEVRLKNAEKEEMEVIKFPDPEASYFVRQRQSLLARRLADDMPVPPPQSEAIAAPGKEVPNVQYWDMSANQVQQLRTVPEHLVPRDRPVFRPSPASLLIANSYGRYLCRTHGADSVQIIRHWREGFPPDVLREEFQSAMFDDIVSDFGGFSK